jgi:hypothetical protein
MKNTSYGLILLTGCSYNYDKDLKKIVMDFLNAPWLIMAETMVER